MNIEMGHGMLTWSMPSLTHRLQAVDHQLRDGMRLAEAYALVAGLESHVLVGLDMSTRPSEAMHQTERLLARQGCNVGHVITAAAKAYQQVVKDYNAMMADARGNSESGRVSGDGPADQAPTTPPASEDSAAA